MAKKKFDVCNSFDRLLPPGLTNSKMLNTLLAQLTVILIRMLVNIGQLSSAVSRVRQRIEEGWDAKTPIPYYYKYPEFDSLMKFSMLLFLLMAVLMLSFSISHYGYYRRESKSIYLMHRLPSKWIIWKQCCTVPLIYAGCVLLLGVVYYGAFCAAYFCFAPDGSIPEQTIAFFWRYVP